MAIDDLLTRADARRRQCIATSSQTVRDLHSQHFTAGEFAELVVSLPRLPELSSIRVLDAGAGVGTLSAALTARLLRDAPLVQIELVAIEVDEDLEGPLIETLDDCFSTAASLGSSFSYTSIIGDFLSMSILGSEGDNVALEQPFDIVIMNPPYKKISRSSVEGKLLTDAGRYSPNMYTAFISLALDYLTKGGQLVSINPRSFTNGVYFRSFRKEIMGRFAFDHLHLFDSRTAVFSDSNVTQETVVLSGTLGGEKDKVVISTSHGKSDSGTFRIVEYSDVVSSEDPSGYVRIAASDVEVRAVEIFAALNSQLFDLGATVSTGKVVDFRNWSRIFSIEQPDAIPLIYPQNLIQGQIRWPVSGRKRQWLMEAGIKASLSFPEGYYVVVKRFTSKEESRRIVAGVWSPDIAPGRVAFENHLNVVNAMGGGLDRNFAVGLCLWLNSTVVDDYFRTVSGSTQANASDLTAISYPEAARLRSLGATYPKLSMPKQSTIDKMVTTVFQ